MKANIIVTLQVEAIHCWPNAKNTLPQMAFLSDPHRHIFWITAKKKVDHGDRQIEIIKFKRELQDYFQRLYFSKELNMCNFEHRSCEMLCEDLMEAYDLEYIQILEDNECGSELWK